MPDGAARPQRPGPDGGPVPSGGAAPFGGASPSGGAALCGGAAPFGASVALRGFGLRPAGATEPVIDALDLNVQPGEVVLLTGPSGMGKSTLLHALAGLLSQDEDPDGSGLRTWGELEVSGRAGLVQQDPETQVVLQRIGDDVAFGAENLGVHPEQIWPRVRSALAAVGLGHLPLNHPTAALSGGQKQRLAVAGLLAMEPGLWLLDEPTANLDPEGAEQVRDVVLQTARALGATVIVVEHRLDLWVDGIDRMVVLGHAGTAGPASNVESVGTVGEDRGGAVPTASEALLSGASVVADGAPAQLLGRPDVVRSLMARGVWVPGHRPELEPFAARTGGAAADAAATGEDLLAARDVAATRHAVPRRAGARARLLSRPGAVAVRGVELTLRAGEATCLMGRNGQGKTALALTLAGLQRSVAGSVELLPALRGPSKHATAQALSPRELVSRIGMVFQDPEHQFVARTVRDELAFGPRRAGVEPEQVQARVETLLRRLHLERWAGSNPYSLSGGQQRRLSVGTALAAQPRVLVLDEPTFGQDAVTWVGLVRLLREELRRGACVVAVTHDHAFAEALAARTLLVDGGAAVLAGEAA